MSGLDKNEQKSFQEYIKLPYKPFVFQEPSEQLNHRLIANIDPDQIYYRGDLDQAASVLKNFVNSQIPEEMDYEMFFKLFRMSQLAIEYYSQDQIQRQQQIDEQYAYYKSLQEQETNLKQFKVKHDEKKLEYIEQMKRLNQKIKELKKEAEKVGNYKCIYCSKCYKEKDGLDSHVKRRHFDMLHEIQETKDMLKERQDPILHLKKRQQEEIREQNKIQLERLQQLQKQLEQTKINESKLVEEISKKLQSDFDTKISQVIEVNNKEIQREAEKSAKKLQEFSQNESQLNQKELIVNESLVKMNENLENFQKAFQKIQEAQDKLNKQQEEYTKQLDKIAENQEELKKSSLQQSTLIKEHQTNGFVGSILSTKQAPLPMNIKQQSKSDTFPVQATPTADFKRGEPKNGKFFEKLVSEDDDSFLNNNSITEEQLSRNRESTNTPLNKGRFQPKIFHLGELEEDFDSQDENKKAFKKHKEEQEQQQLLKNSILPSQKDTSLFYQPEIYYNETPSQNQINNPKSQTKIQKPSSSELLKDNDNQGINKSVDEKQQLIKDTSKGQQLYLKKPSDYKEDHNDNEEVDYFQSQKSDRGDTPKKPNVLSNQISFGVKYDNQQDLNSKKSNFGSNQKHFHEDTNLTIKEQVSQENQFISKKSSHEELKEKQNEKDKKSKKDKKKKKRSSSSSSISDSSKSSLSDISERMKNNKKDKKDKKDSKKHKKDKEDHDSRKSFGSFSGEDNHSSKNEEKQKKNELKREKSKNESNNSLENKSKQNSNDGSNQQNSKKNIKLDDEQKETKSKSEIKLKNEASQPELKKELSDDQQKKDTTSEQKIIKKQDNDQQSPKDLKENKNLPSSNQHIQSSESQQAKEHKEQKSNSSFTNNNKPSLNKLDYETPQFDNDTLQSDSKQTQQLGQKETPQIENDAPQQENKPILSSDNAHKISKTNSIESNELKSQPKQEIQPQNISLQNIQPQNISSQNIGENQKIESGVLQKQHSNQNMKESPKQQSVDQLPQEKSQQDIVEVQQEQQNQQIKSDKQIQSLNSLKLLDDQKQQNIKQEIIQSDTKIPIQNNPNLEENKIDLIQLQQNIKFVQAENTDKKDGLDLYKESSKEEIEQNIAQQLITGNKQDEYLKSEKNLKNDQQLAGIGRHQVTKKNQENGDIILQNNFENSEIGEIRKSLPQENSKPEINKLNKNDEFSDGNESEDNDKKILGITDKKDIQSKTQINKVGGVFDEIGDDDDF